MPSIFEGVPFIYKTPFDYQREDSSALNAGLAAGAAAGRTQLARQQGNQQNALEERKLLLEEKQQGALSAMQGLRLLQGGMELDTARHEAEDKIKTAAWLTQLKSDPNAERPTYYNLKNENEAIELQAKLQAQITGITQKDLAMRTNQQINDSLPDALQAQYFKRLATEGPTPALIQDISDAASVDPKPTAQNFAYAQRKQQEAVAAGDQIGAATWANTMENMRNAGAFNREQTTISMEPGGMTTVTQGPARAGASGKLAPGEQLNLDLNRSLDDIAFLRRNLRAEDLGLAGWAGEKLDIILPEMGVNSTYDKARTTNRERIKLLGIGVGPLLTAEKRFSNEDRQRVEQALVRSGAIESLPHAQDLLDTLGDSLGERNIRVLLEENKGDAYKTRETILSGDLRYRNPYTLKAAASDKFRLITPAQARNISVSGNPNDPNPPRPMREMQGPPAPGRGY